MLPLLFWFRLFSWQPEVLPSGVALNHSRLASDRVSLLFPSIKKSQHQTLAEKKKCITCLTKTMGSVFCNSQVKY